jgi:phage/plasmid primase-like uncharacterized protein
MNAANIVELRPLRNARPRHASDWGQWITRAHAVRVEDEIARRGIRLSGGIERCGPCPICGGTDRFGVNLGKQVWNCRGCQRGGDVIALVEHLDGCDFVTACEILIAERRGNGSAEERPGHHSKRFAQVDGDAKNDDPKRSSRALKLWYEAGPLSRLALDYFRSRGIPELPLPGTHDVLRFHSRCPFGTERHPCIIALLRNIVTNVPQAIHRTALTPDGKKLARKALGPKAGTAIKLWPDEDVTAGLVIGEGLETTLSAAAQVEHRGTLLRPAWAAVDAGNMAEFPVLPGVESLTVLVDNDESGRGQEAARECARRWLKARREAILLTPHNLGADFNDLVGTAS